MQAADTRAEAVGSGFRVMKRCMGEFWRSQSGATAIEYALIAGFIALVCTTALQVLGVSLNTKFTTVGNALQQ